MTQFDSKVARVTKVAQVASTLVTIAYVWVVASSGSLWLLLLAPLVWGCTILILMFFAGIYLAATSDTEELESALELDVHRFNQLAQGRLDPGNPEHVEAGKRIGIILGTVVAVSPEIAARYLDQVVPEWVEVQTESGITRLHFDSVAARDPKTGDFITPSEEGAALINGVIFKKAST